MCEGIRAHASAVVFTKKTEYYPFIKDEDVRNTAVFTPKYMLSSICFPWISNLSAPSYDSILEVLLEAGLNRNVIYMKGRSWDMPAFAKPGTALSFYQILDRGSKKDRLLSEALFTGLITESASREEVRETVFFYDAPYRPQTMAGLKAVRMAQEAGTAFIGIYNDDAKDYDSGKYGLTMKKRRIYIKEDGSHTGETEVTGLLTR